uniref:Nuclear receptor 2C2 associated protein n=1 Tax=Amazona collaria TaxID=241587 RepID=A0A8B9EY08_9PSIT
MPVEPLICSDTATRVSSVLNRDVKHFGKKHMFDASEETCWNSDQGACQWVTLDFPRSVRVSQLHIQFQGGFSSRLCTLEGEELGWGHSGPSASVYPGLHPTRVFVSYSQTAGRAEAMGWSRGG